jgi:hypothetical protein
VPSAPVNMTLIIGSSANRSKRKHKRRAPSQVVEMSASEIFHPQQQQQQQQPSSRRRHSFT